MTQLIILYCGRYTIAWNALRKTMQFANGASNDTNEIFVKQNKNKKEGKAMT